MKKLLAIVVAALAISFGLVAAHTATTSSAAGAEPEAVIREYYRAVNAKTLSVAVPLLSDAIVLRVNQPYTSGYLEYAGIEDVQRYLDADIMRVNYAYIQNISVRGDMVEYTLTEWHNPRIVGPAGPFPAVNRYTAIVRDGKIVSIIQQSPLG
jgi:hypothetical protein